MREKLLIMKNMLNWYEFQKPELKYAKTSMNIMNYKKKGPAEIEAF